MNFIDKVLNYINNGHYKLDYHPNLPWDWHMMVSVNYNSNPEWFLDVLKGLIFDEVRLHRNEVRLDLTRSEQLLLKKAFKEAYNKEKQKFNDLKKSLKDNV